MEDNKLWLRHLLNLVVQAVLAVYVFWKSIGRHSVTLLVLGTLVFVVGVIKYGERIWSLRSARFESLEESSGLQYKPRLAYHASDDDYCSTVLYVTFQMRTVFSIFVSRASIIFEGYSQEVAPSEIISASPDTYLSRSKKKAHRLKSLEICLGLMYDDLYTKALGLRTLRGVMLRCISQICALVAFIVFIACDRRRYGRVDMVITYSLFMGCLSLEVCGLVRLMASPWTWLWTSASVSQYMLKLNKFSWFLLSNVDLTGWSQKRSLWSNAMGQYNFYGWLKGSDEQEQHKQPRYSFSQQRMTVVKRLATLLSLEKEKIFFINKLLDREHVKVGGLLECLVDSRVDRFVFKSRNPRELPNLGAVFSDPKFLDFGFGTTIVSMHLLTEQLLCKSAQHSDVEANAAAAAAHTSNINLLMEEYRKLSRYMIYLMVACPSLLPLEDSSVAMLQQWQQSRGQIMVVLETNPIEELVNLLRLEKETLEEIKEVWIGLIIYAASKSRPELHASQLARGGELLTFVWLKLRLNLFGTYSRIELTNKPFYDTFHALHLPTRRSGSTST